MSEHSRSRQRSPRTSTAALARHRDCTSCLAGDPGPSSDPELFVNRRGEPLSRSGVEYLLAKYVRAASATQDSLLKKRVSPHVLRHTCAMHTLLATRDVRKVALWLGHANLQTTEVYLRADPTEKLEAIEAAFPATLRRGRFHAPDRLIASLKPTPNRP